MSVEWSSRVWRESPYKGTKLLVHLALADFANNDGWLFASQARLAQMGRCTPEYVRTTINEFQAEGWLVIAKKGVTRGRATEYQLQLPKTVGEYPPTPSSEPPNSEGDPPKSAGGHPSLQRELQLPECVAADAARDESVGQRVNRVTRTYTDRVKLSPFHGVRAVVEAAVKAGYSDEQIVPALSRLADSNRPVSANSLRIEIEGMNVTAPRVTAFMEQQAKFAAMDAAERRELGA